MRKFILILLIIIIQTNVIVFAEDTIAQPTINAQASILMDYETGRILWGKNIDEPLAMASTTKIMTAIVAIENASLDEIVTVSKNAASAPRVKMYLKENEEIKLEYLLYALMLQSSNDAAVAIAEHISGNVDIFCNLMTEKAKELGAKDTVFKTPNGLDSEDHHSTAYDLAVITRYALSNETFKKIIGTRNISFKSNLSSYDVVNKNRLLSEYGGAIGVKTGYTGKAGHCFVGAATIDGMTVISVVLASGWGSTGREQKWIDTKEILNYAFNNFKNEQVISIEDCQEVVEIRKGSQEYVQLTYEKEVVAPLKEDEKDKIEILYEYESIVDAPIYQNQKLGVAKIYIGDELLAEVNLLAKEGVAKNDFKAYFEKILKNWLNIYG